ncbi:class I SAM-dependent methyltransferase [Micromonospora sediminicola]|uniref:class I SAM-dependent methyltransferase n=1 Tax=Micromonospora sediminicola TaxID=946078 RepID=UPI00379554E0
MHPSTEPRLTPADITLAHVESLYRTYEHDLRRVRDEQRALRHGNPSLKAQLDDLEAEITYLLVRDSRPSVVVEIGSLHGWSTNWLLRALRDNAAGRLFTHDLIDNARRNVAPDLADGRWTFVSGAAQETLRDHTHEIDYLFIDAAHTARFARWFAGELFPTVRPGVPVSVHDVFHGRRPWPLSEGRVVLSWLAQRDTPHFTASRAAAPRVNAALTDLKSALGLTEQVHDGCDDPMLFFRMP